MTVRLPVQNAKNDAVVEVWSDPSALRSIPSDTTSDRIPRFTPNCIVLNHRATGITAPRQMLGSSLR